MILFKIKEKMGGGETSLSLSLASFKLLNDYHQSRMWGAGGERVIQAWACMGEQELSG